MGGIWETSGRHFGKASGEHLGDVLETTGGASGGSLGGIWGGPSTKGPKSKFGPKNIKKTEAKSKVELQNWTHKQVEIIEFFDEKH